jgi:pyruvate formate lyase activating enzyme
MISEKEILDVREPPGKAMGKVAELWKPLEGTNKIICTACARYCKIGEGQVGLCGIRGVHEGKLWLYVYGRVITGHVDPIEKKPVSHYRPGSKIFSIATTGCNWLCHPAGTPILMADGTTKPVEDIGPGDALWSIAESTWRAVPDVVTAAGSRKAAVFRATIDARREPLLGTAEHPVLTPMGWRPISSLRPGDLTLIQDESLPRDTRSRTIQIPNHSLEVHPLETGAYFDLLTRRDLLGPRFRWSRVRGIAAEDGTERVYSFECVPFHTYIAADVVVHNCRYCFVPGTKVITSQGLESIEDIFASSTPTDNEEVRRPENLMALTHRGRWRRVANAFEHLYTGPVLEFKIPGVENLKCTPDHRVYASVAGGPVEVVRADRLRVGDRLVVPRTKSPHHVKGMPRWVEYYDRIEAMATTATASGSGLMLQRAQLLERFFSTEFVFVSIRAISSKTYVGPVYNIEVEEDHSYTANLMAVANCQNADISQRRKVEGIEVEPQDVVRMTLEQGCQGLAYTYNQPTIFIEFARDIGMRARQAGLINIFVSNGYDTPETVAEMPKFLDCVTVDFKGSGETSFVRKYINIPNADPIFQTLLDTRDTKKIHIEITDLIVPQVGDDLGAARHLSRWVLDNLGPDTPIHFLRFHPDYKMMEFPWTPVETLEKHCAVAKEEGLKYVYIGNVPGHPLENTYCPGCGAIAIKRYGYDTTGWYLDKDNKCKKCGYKLAIFGRLEQTAKENRFYSVLYHR